MLFGLIVIILLIFALMVIWKLFFGTIDLILDFFPKLCDTIAKSTTALVSKLTSGTSEIGEVVLTLILITAITILLIILTKKFYDRLSRR